MRFIEKLKLIERIDQLIRLKGTGSARDLAKRLGVSKSTVYDILEVMRLMGSDIDYCSIRKSYFYNTDKILAIGFVDREKNETLLNELKGDLNAVVLHLVEENGEI